MKRCFLAVWALAAFQLTTSLQALPDQKGTAPAKELADSCSAVIRSLGFQDRQVGLVVLDAKGDLWVEIQSDQAFQPASNQKILVASAALARLGPEYQYETVLWSDRPPADGTLQGPLVVTGSGDPNVSGRFSNGDPTAIFREWAAALKKAGVSRVAGDLLVDDFRFDNQRFLESWKKNQASRWYSAQVGALNLNDNCVDVTVLAEKNGAPAGYRLSPATAYLSVENKCKTSTDGKPVIRLERETGTNRLLLDGKIPLRTREWSDPVTVDDPGLYFGTVLKEILAAEGVAIDGKVVRDAARLPKVEKRVELHKHLSSLKRDLPVILQNSQNLHAEVLLKALGAALGKGGSVVGGAKAIEEFLGESKIPAPALHIADGSGYSVDNRVAPLTLARCLHWAAQQAFFPLFRDSLSVAGSVGTLKHRFRETSLERNVFAKTGYIAGVSTLSGYVRLPSKGVRESPASKEVWTFALLINGFPRQTGLTAAHKLQEEIVTRIQAAMARATLKS